MVSVVYLYQDSAGCASVGLSNQVDITVRRLSDRATLLSLFSYNDLIIEAEYADLDTAGLYARCIFDTYMATNEI